MRTSSSSGPGELAASVGSFARDVAGKVRRFVVTRTSSALWQIAGHVGIDGEEQETRDAEVFTPAGFYSRPADGGAAEAVVVFVGERGQNPLVVVCRDEATRQAVAGDLAAGETQIHNRGAVVRIKVDGTIEIRSVGGVALPLPTLADVVAIKTAIHDAAVTAGDGGASFKAAILTSLAGWPAGTVVVKAE